MTHFNRATRLLQNKRYDKAIIYFKRQLESQEFKECWLNLGNCYHQLNQDDKAISCFLKAADPHMPFSDNSYGEYPLALNNLGLIAYSNGDPETAKTFYRQALTIDPLYGECVWNLANATLKSSGCSTGWDLYEYRFNRGASSVKIDTHLPRWDFKSTGDSITVLTEQGQGDKIQFARYLPLLKNYFKEVVVACHSSLNTLFPDYACVAAPQGNLAVPLCSLPRAFGVVGPVDCYSCERVELTGFNIGIVSTGSPSHVNDQNRSTKIGYFAKLARFGKLWNLNPQDPKHPKITHVNPQSWTDTIRFVRSLDLVVSVDTSIVHLAGTLGIPTLMLQPLRDTDFRWGMPGVQNPWYPSVKVIDNPGSWDQVFEVVEGVVDAYHKQTRH